MFVVNLVHKISGANLLNRNEENAALVIINNHHVLAIFKLLKYKHTILYAPPLLPVMLNEFEVCFYVSKLFFHS